MVNSSESPYCLSNPCSETSESPYCLPDPCSETSESPYCLPDPCSETSESPYCLPDPCSYSWDTKHPWQLCEWYRNNLTKTSKKWSWTSIVGVYDCSSCPIFTYKPTCIFHVKPHLFKTLFRGNFLTNFVEIFAHKHKMCVWSFSLLSSKKILYSFQLFTI
jgi:hypothetical protein